MMAVQLSDDSIGKAARRQQIIDGLHDIPGQIKRVLDQDKEFQTLAKDMLGEKSLLIMGRGYQCEYLLWSAKDGVITAGERYGGIGIGFSRKYSDGARHDASRTTRERGKPGREVAMEDIYAHEQTLRAWRVP